MSDERIKSRLYVVVEAGQAAGDRLAAALAAADVASVLICPPPAGKLDAANARGLVELAQKAGAAALLADDAELARTLRADGVHLSASEDPASAYEAARSILGGRYIVGADTGGSRDDAMTLAEIGADYIAFRSDGDAEASARRDELAAWWAEIFEVPCVALDVASADEAAHLQAARCDFVGLALPASEPPAASRDFVAAVHAGLAAQFAEAPQ